MKFSKTLSFIAALFFTFLFSNIAQASLINPGASFAVDVHVGVGPRAGTTWTGYFTVGGLNTTIATHHPTVEPVFNIDTFTFTFGSYTFSGQSRGWYSEARNSLAVCFDANCSSPWASTWFAPATPGTGPVEFWDMGNWMFIDSLTPGIGSLNLGRYDVRLLQNGPAPTIPTPTIPTPTTPAPVPEPALPALLCVGLAALAAIRRRQG